ncbi:MAG: cytochrome c [Methylobacterium mesophilicum]|nr:cytochrome c [Methylobacterium mesophilicum]
MKKRLATLGLGLVALTLAACNWPGGDSKEQGAAPPNYGMTSRYDQGDKIIRGRYVAVLADCEACHTVPGGKYLAGGNALATPFGTLVPPNITPDPTGIGNWSEADFHRMMKTGRGHDGKRLYPAMPYPAYSNMTDGDISDLWAYLTTVEPVSNKVEANQLPFPFNIRLAMAGWNLVNFTENPWKPDPNASAEINRGAYLVNGPGHCGTCHTPKSALGADKTSQFLQGASLQGWYAPNLTGDPRSGLGSWSADDIVAYLRNGVNGRSIASGPMAEAVEASTSAMTDPDLKAIAAYLKTLPAGGVDKDAPAPPPERMARGEAIYRDNCSACHGGNGKGQPPLFPALAGDAVVMQPSVETLARMVQEGSQAGHTKNAPTSPAMPALGWRLNDAEIADVLTYIRNSWGNRAAEVSASAVGDARGGS